MRLSERYTDQAGRAAPLGQPGYRARTGSLGSRQLLAECAAIGIYGFAMQNSRAKNERNAGLFGMRRKKERPVPGALPGNGRRQVAG